MFLLSGPKALFSLLSVQGKARWKKTEILYLAEGQIFSLLESSWKVLRTQVGPVKCCTGGQHHMVRASQREGFLWRMSAFPSERSLACHPERAALHGDIFETDAESSAVTLQ